MSVLTVCFQCSQMVSSCSSGDGSGDESEHATDDGSELVSRKQADGARYG